MWILESNFPKKYRREYKNLSSQRGKAASKCLVNGVKLRVRMRSVMGAKIAFSGDGFNHASIEQL